MTRDRDLALTPIATIASDYPDKFGVPRQPGLVPAARGVVSLYAPYDDPAAVDGLATYSHLWLTFVFDRNPDRWRARVRPPRLGGNERVGVFATRSTYRPNRLGLSRVALLDIATFNKPEMAPWSSADPERSPVSRTHLLIGGHDLVAATPIVDIKPYLPWVDAALDARAALAPTPPAEREVRWSPTAAAAIAGRADAESLRALVDQVLAQDPRPAYRRDDGARIYGLALRDVDVRFTVDARNGVIVQAIVGRQPPI